MALADLVQGIGGNPSLNLDPSTIDGIGLVVLTVTVPLETLFAAQLIEGRRNATADCVVTRRHRLGDHTNSKIFDAVIHVVAVILRLRCATRRRVLDVRPRDALESDGPSSL